MNVNTLGNIAKDCEWVAAHKRERKQAAVKVGTGFHVELEMDSRWNNGFFGCDVAWNLKAPSNEGLFLLFTFIFITAYKGNYSSY